MWPWGLGGAGGEGEVGQATKRSNMGRVLKQFLYILNIVLHVIYSTYLRSRSPHVINKEFDWHSPAPPPRPRTNLVISMRTEVVGSSIHFGFFRARGLEKRQGYQSRAGSKKSEKPRASNGTETFFFFGGGGGGGGGLGFRV